MGGSYMQSIIDYKLIGNRIKNKRIELHMTQNQLSQKANISMTYLSKIEHGHVTPTLETYALISNILDLDLAHLITGSSKISSDYTDNELLRICKKADETQLKLIIKLARVILDE